MSEGNEGPSAFELGFAAMLDGTFTASVQEVLDDANLALARRDDSPDGEWEIYDAHMAPDFLLSCPHGHVIEQDGSCSDGCESPLRGAGIV